MTDARLGGDLPPEFGSPVIDRSRPVRFTLAGRPVAALEGDTVLSALLANGIASVGTLYGHPVALDAHTAPAVARMGNENRPDLAMPMALCPAIEGMSLAIVGQNSPFSRPRLPWTGSRRTSLGLALDPAGFAPGGWIGTPPSRTIAADVIVVGGGVAGLSAALAAAQSGLRVRLVEMEPVLGGLSILFGKAEGQPDPHDLIGDLVARVEGSPLVSIHRTTLAYDLFEGCLRTIGVVRSQGAPRPEHFAFTAPRIVLATGMTDRLPIFPGNRLPGVVSAGFAWRMAARYNLWPGPRAHVHTATNVGYRMALLGAAAGRTITRTSDPRVDPQTRFIEFCKAYGYRLGWGSVISTVQRDRKGRLAVALADSERGARTDSATVTDRLIVSGGWQPDLDLWMRGGGAVAWDRHRGQILAAGDLSGVDLAGSVAGYMSLTGCAEHGRGVIAAAPGKPPAAISDPRIDPMFETPDGLHPVMAPESHREPPAYVGPDGPAALEPPAAGWRWLKRAHSVPPPPVAGTPSDIAGAIVANRLDPTHLDRFRAERYVLPIPIKAVAPHAQTRSPIGDTGLPSWLDKRFGPDQGLHRLFVENGRRLDPGCLVFADTDTRDPREAIGVVIGQTPDGITALMSGNPGISPGDTVHVRDGTALIAARLRARL